MNILKRRFSHKILVLDCPEVACLIYSTLKYLNACEVQKGFFKDLINPKQIIKLTVQFTLPHFPLWFRAPSGLKATNSDTIIHTNTVYNTQL